MFSLVYPVKTTMMNGCINKQKQSYEITAKPFALLVLSVTNLMYDRSLKNFLASE